MANSVKHSHAKAGGGTATHEHEFSINDAHGHEGMLPLPKKAGSKAKGKPFGEPRVVSLLFNERIDASESWIPYVQAGSWHWADYGDVKISPEDCDSLVTHFNDNVRGQDLPIINEAHDSNRAIGWVKELKVTGPGKVDAHVEWNPAGDEAIAKDQFRYVSPELIFDYEDSETGNRYNVVAAGVGVHAQENPSAHALTNYPRMKKLGRIAASETGPEMVALAFGERVRSDNPFKAARKLMAEYGDDPNEVEDDDGNVPLCVFQPGGSTPMGCCPGFTRIPGDTDGDGTCLFAEMGCNGYRAISDDGAQQAFMTYSEVHKMGDETQTATAPPVVPVAGTEPEPDEQDDKRDPDKRDPAPAMAAANMAEVNAILAAERTARQTTERQFAETRKELAEVKSKLAQTEADAKVKAVTVRLSEAKRQGKMTPAEFDEFTTDGSKLVSLAENQWFLDAIEKRPSTIDFSEKGTGNEAAPTRDNSHLVEAANGYIAEQGKAGKTVSFAEAARHVARTQGGRQ